MDLVAAVLLSRRVWEVLVAPVGMGCSGHILVRSFHIRSCSPVAAVAFAALPVAFPPYMAVFAALLPTPVRLPQVFTLPLSFLRACLPDLLLLLLRCKQLPILQ